VYSNDWTNITTKSCIKVELNKFEVLLLHIFL